MKKTLFLIAFVASSFTMNAQDILVRKGGEVENVKVIEVSPTEVKYKKNSNPDGPVFIEKRSNIYSIKYQNGEVQTLGEGSVQYDDTKYYSKHGKEKKFTHEIDAFIGTGWGVGYQLRREFNPYVGWNIFGISYIATDYNQTKSGLLNFKLLGVSGYTPSYKWIRGYADVNLGYTLDYNTRYWRGESTSFCHCFGWQTGLGIQLHKNIAIGCEFVFCTEGNLYSIGARVSALF